MLNKKIIRLASALKSLNLNTYANDVLLLKQAVSKQSIVSLGIPEVIAKILIQKFDKNAFTIAKWIKEYYSYLPNMLDAIKYDSFADRGMKFYIDMYESTENEESYLNFLNKEDFHIPDFIDLENSKKIIKDEIEEILFDSTFFKSLFIKEILSKKIINLHQYKDLSFNDATIKWESKKIFEDTPALKKYPDGFKWIDVGKRCDLIRGPMSNCGSALSRTSGEYTIYTLFDEINNPHVMVTYDFDDKRIHADVGKGQSDVKEKYHPYVLDLINTLGGWLDTSKQGSVQLRIKYRLRDIIHSIERLVLSEEVFPGHEESRKNTTHHVDDIYKFYDKDRNVFYTDYYNVISQKDFNNAKEWFIKNEKPKTYYIEQNNWKKFKEADFAKLIFRRKAYEDLISKNIINPLSFLEFEKIYINKKASQIPAGMQNFILNTGLFGGSTNEVDDDDDDDNDDDEILGKNIYKNNI